jgi:CBS domain-containing protein
MAESCAPGPELVVTDQDVLEAMQEIQGYLDITPGDFKELYLKAFAHARRRLFQARKIKEAMTRQVLTARPGDPLPQVAEAMAARGVSGAPVLNEAGKVIGVISEKDFLGLIQGGGEGSLMALISGCLGGRGCLVGHLQGKTAGDIMTSPAISLGPEASLAEAAELLAARGINRVPVVDGQGLLLGIVTRSDLLRPAGEMRP